jgi:hypothetical protein
VGSAVRHGSQVNGYPSLSRDQTQRKEVMFMQWVIPDFEEFETAGEVTLYQYHW